jgi:hypothetical protein
MSAATNERNVGAAALPEDGPANILFAVCVLSEKDNAGVVVAVATLVVKSGERFPEENEVTVPPVAGAALVQFVPSEVRTFPDEPGTAYVSVEATQFVPSETIIFRVVALAFGNVGVLHVGAALAPDISA